MELKERRSVQLLRATTQSSASLLSIEQQPRIPVESARQLDASLSLALAAQYGGNETEMVAGLRATEQHSQSR